MTRLTVRSKVRNKPKSDMKKSTTRTSEHVMEARKPLSLTLKLLDMNNNSFS